MKPHVFLLVIAACTNASLYIPTTLQKIFTLKELLGIGQPKVPQVVLDTSHPWLTGNKTWLSRYPNARTAICNKESDLWTKPTIPERALPLDLLTNIDIDNNKYGVDRLGWKNAFDRLQELKTCPAALQDAKSFHIKVYLHDDIYGLWKENTSPPPELPYLLGEVLSSMPNLEKLNWGIRPESTAPFDAAFTKANVTLPNLKHLIGGAHDEWLVPRCPHLDTITMGVFFGDKNPDWKAGDDPTLKYGRSSLALINATKGLPLQSMAMKARYYADAKWMTLLEALLDVQPNITNIEMNGDLYPEAEWTNNPEELKQHLSLLSRFSNLTSLTLPPVSRLGLGFDGGHWCGNAYGGPDGRAYGREVVQQGAAALEMAANLTMEALPYLKQLTIGESRPNITLSEEGKIELVWPWTNRMKEYTYEIWPEIEDYFDGVDY